jgi:hypothetical protein
MRRRRIGAPAPCDARRSLRACCWLSLLFGAAVGGGLLLRVATSPAPVSAPPRASGAGGGRGWALHAPSLRAMLRGDEVRADADAADAADASAAAAAAAAAAPPPPPAWDYAHGWPIGLGAALDDAALGALFARVGAPASRAEAAAIVAACSPPGFTVATEIAAVEVPVPIAAFDSSRVERELLGGRALRGLEETMRDSVASLLHWGHVKPPGSGEPDVCVGGTGLALV